MKAIWIAAAACLLSFASAAAHAKNVCDVHHLGYTKAQCEECSNMTWSVSRVFPNGTCVATNPQTKPIVVGGEKGVAPPQAPRVLCNVQHSGYTKAECDRCMNMTWNAKGVCVSKGTPQSVTTSGAPKGIFATPPKGTTPTAAAGGCTLTSWGGATLPLNAPNFSMTGTRVTACSKGYDLAKSQLHCSTGVPATPPNAPTTNVTCNKTTGVGGNTQVTINGQPCCLN